MMTSLACVGLISGKVMVWTGSESTDALQEYAHVCSRWIVSIASVESTHARLITLVTQFGASAAVVDEPVAHLSHTDTSSLFVVDEL
jgi:hypothetical protein